MKRGIKSILIILLAILIFAANANAALVDNGNGTITDTNTNLMWLQDANYAKTSGYVTTGGMNWDTAMAWADTLVFAGYDDWRLPITPVPDNSCWMGDPIESYGYCSGSEMGSLFYNEDIHPWNQAPFNNIQDKSYWSSTGYSTMPDDVKYIFSFGYGGSIFGGGWQDGRTKINSNTYAWAVRDVSAAPEPISSILFVTGGTLLAGRRYLTRRRS